MNSSWTSLSQTAGGVPTSHCDNEYRKPQSVQVDAIKATSTNQREEVKTAADLSVAPYRDAKPLSSRLLSTSADISYLLRALFSLFQLNSWIIEWKWLLARIWNTGGQHRKKRGSCWFCVCLVRRRGRACVYKCVRCEYQKPTCSADIIKWEIVVLGANRDDCREAAAWGQTGTASARPLHRSLTVSHEASLGY